MATPLARQREEDEPHRNAPAAGLVEHESRKSRPTLRSNFEFPRQPLPEHVADFFDLEGFWGRRHDVGENFEAGRRQMRRAILDDLAAQHEKAAHQVGKIGVQGSFGQSGRKATDHGAALRKALVRRAAFDMAAADDEVAAGPQFCQHLRQDALVMLQIGVHHRDDWRAGGEHALDAGARQPAPVDAAQAAHAQILMRHFLGQHRRAVRAVVVHHDHFPIDAGQGGIDSAEQFAQISAFVEGGNDKSQFGGQGRGLSLRAFFSGSVSASCIAAGSPASRFEARVKHSRSPAGKGVPSEMKQIGRHVWTFVAGKARNRNNSALARA